MELFFTRYFGLLFYYLCVVVIKVPEKRAIYRSEKNNWSPGRDLNSGSPDILTKRQQSSDIQVRRFLGKDHKYGQNHLDHLATEAQ
jgi:hypothetical protein